MKCFEHYVIACDQWLCLKIIKFWKSPVKYCKSITVLFLR